MNCPKSIREEWRRELWEEWEVRILGESIKFLGKPKKICYRDLKRLVSMAEILSLSEDDSIVRKMAEVRRSVFQKHRVIEGFRNN